MEQDLVIACKVCGQVHDLPPLETGDCGVLRSVRIALSQAIAAVCTAPPRYRWRHCCFTSPPTNCRFFTWRFTAQVSENTVLDGAIRFYKQHDYVIATIVLLASVVIPLLKLLGLLFVVGTTAFGSTRLLLLRTWIFRFIDSIGRWAMLDVFVVAIWVAVVKLGELANVTAGKGLLPFGCVVVLTLLASAAFDPQLIWEPKGAAK